MDKQEMQKLAAFTMAVVGSAIVPQTDEDREIKDKCWRMLVDMAAQLGLGELKPGRFDKVAAALWNAAQPTGAPCLGHGSSEAG